MSPGPEPLEFAGYLARVCAKSAKTVAAYTEDVAAYQVFLAERQQTLDSGMDRRTVAIYLMERTEPRRRQDNEPPQLSSRSAARAVSAFKAYAQYLVFTGQAPDNPLAALAPPKYTRALPPYFTSEELRQLVTVYDAAPEPLKIRNAALLHLLYAAGLRVSECAGLDLPRVNLRERWVTVMGKGRKQRVTPFGTQAAAALQRYLTQGRPGLCGPRSGEALWLNQRGGRLGTRGIYNVLRQAVLAAGLIKHLSPHKLRHACATHLMEGGADVRLVQELLGHESLNTTQVYTQITRRHLREVYERAHPRAVRPAKPDQEG